METTTAMPACCTEGSGPDFSHLNFEFFGTLLAVAVYDPCLWLSAALIICFPLYTAVASRYLSSAQRKISSLDKRDRDRKIAEIAGLCLCLLRAAGFKIAIDRQPLWEFLDEKWVPFVGFITITTGLTTLMLCGFDWGFYKLYLALDRPPPSQSVATKADQFSTTVRDRCRPQIVWRSMGTIAVFLGYSLIAKSQAGLMLTWLLWISMFF